MSPLCQECDLLVCQNRVAADRVVTRRASRRVVRYSHLGVGRQIKLVFGCLVILGKVNVGRPTDLVDAQIADDLFRRGF